jgi:hypothetical protein
MAEIIKFPSTPKDAGGTETWPERAERKLTPASQENLAQIKPDQLAAVTRIMRSIQGISPEVEKTVQQRMSGWSTQELIDFINEASAADMQTNSTAYYVAFGMLVEYE